LLGGKLTLGEVNGARRRYGEQIMRNVGKIDQYIRIVVGLAMIAFVFRNGSADPVWPAVLPIGLILLATAFFSLCPLYTLLGWSTVKTKRIS
jgi:hypothetical protein